MSPIKQSLIMLHIAILLLGGNALFAKLIPLSALDISIYRAVLGCLTLFLVLIISGARIRLFKLRDYFICAILGALLGAHWVTYFQSMQLSTVAIGVITVFTYPVMTVILEPLFDKSLPHLRDIAIGAFMLLGVYLMVPPLNADNDISTGVLLGLLSALLFAFRNLLHKRHLSHYSGQHAMTYQIAFAALTLCWFIDVTPSHLSHYSLAMLLLAGVVFTAAPHALFAGAFTHLKAKSIALISCLVPLYGTLLALIILQEVPSWRTLIGGTIVTSAAVFETLQTQKGKTESC
ncbi:DMT family transporter [Flocculibacter collagenilyticus]|uniref:DMT family transporter n=1 Tax=Flocculibacter collagenilyticus TaxID=2744479 RepID=UPI0018F3D105|nr:EamA family transporter [Flocculibacter collagenilyticus]